MKFILTMEDNPTTGELDVKGEVEGAQDNQLPTGAQIMYAYMSQHMPQITSAAQDWFRGELIARVSKAKDEVATDVGP